MQLQSPTSIIVVVYSHFMPSQSGACERIDFMLLMSSRAGDHGALPLDPGAHTKDELVYVVTIIM